MELTTEKSNRMVAEQLLSIVQQDLAEQQLRVSVETTARVKVENELVFVKVCSLFLQHPMLCVSLLWTCLAPLYTCIETYAYV